MWAYKNANVWLETSIHAIVSYEMCSKRNIKNAPCAYKSFLLLFFLAAAELMLRNTKQLAAYYGAKGQHKYSLGEKYKLVENPYPSSLSDILCVLSQNQALDIPEVGGVEII